MIHIDLNSDVGEGVGNEAQLMPYLSSCNIACGGHAGDTATMLEVLAFAKISNVKIGAHPSYPDRSNFGREAMTISNALLKESITSQIKLLINLAAKSGQHVHHVKPHGALYNQAAKDEQIAHLIIDTILEIDDRLVLYVPHNSVIASLAVSKLAISIEGFADRNYNDDYSLVSRSLPDAVLTSHSTILPHVLQMVKQRQLKTVNNLTLPFDVNTLCVHGDTENALQIVKEIHKAFTQENILIK
ncbi:5-oxoprolinase subunit PxpA [Dokdonia sp. PRO95]|uniref:5-oxoprolinase subunit PxpA n=1 Tax=Dokdonia sp. PRO95 TaxID=1239415 RepID=UPI0005577693|nr:5-oxoprolinase subunit PxpA [Dokdonia sp. PRO95]